jgi:hypothetical protein
LAVTLIVAASSSARADSLAPAATVLALPSPGNVTVARLALKSAAGTPRLALANGRRGLPAGAIVLASVARGSAAGRYSATVAIVNPPSQVTPAPRSAGVVSLVVPPGVTLAGPVRVARNVLYQNAKPPFGLVLGGTASVLASSAPTKLPAVQIVRDAQLLALDRSVPLADMQLLGLEYVAVDFAPPGTASQSVTIGLSQLGQVNAVELRFPTGTRVTRVSGPPETDGLPVGTGVQLIASRGFFQEGLVYKFTLELSRPLRKGDSVRVRASTHYFESSLPFTERFVLG